jgi:hypothetical protein
MKRIFSIILAIIFMAGALSACGGSGEPDIRISMPASSKDLEGSDYQEVISQLQSAGFTNIDTAVLDDLITGWLTKDGEVESVDVGGNTTFSSGAKYEPDVTIVVTYHTFPAKETADEEQTPVPTEAPEALPTEEVEAMPSEVPASSEVTVSFSDEEAFRAAVVAFTNMFADDIFTADGMDYDMSKLHSYADISGFYMAVDSKGTWTGKSEDAWHVEHLKLTVPEYGTIVDASLDVSYDGTNYIVSNLAGKAPSYDDNDSRFSSMKDLEDGSGRFLTIAPSLIADGRDTSALPAQSQTSDVSEHYPSGVSSWDGDHTELKKLIKKNMNDEKSYKHIETKWIYIVDDTTQQEINELFAGIGWSDTVSVGDFVIITEFSGKNAYNATIKNKAYGIEYKDGSVKLISVQ